MYLSFRSKFDIILPSMTRPLYRDSKIESCRSFSMLVRSMLREEISPFELKSILGGRRNE